MTLNWLAVGSLTDSRVCAGWRTFGGKMRAEDGKGGALREAPFKKEKKRKERD